MDNFPGVRRCQVLSDVARVLRGTWGARVLARKGARGERGELDVKIRGSLIPITIICIIKYYISKTQREYDSLTGHD